VVTQLGRGRLRLPPGRSDLASLGLPRSAWPTVVVRDRAGCAGARIDLRIVADRSAR
jgi:hypothetical protein